mmetsp:Transcript_7506/g.9263  ORF Transcript_7506/g.9263 Transcript_7506/m.9263 type:complete len:236 (-) Transcript_7506:630-1337(-)
MEVASNSITAVASRIQERALQLASERASLNVILTELKQANETLQLESKENAKIRRKLLSIVRSRHEVELEFIGVQDEIATLGEKTNHLKNDTKENMVKISKIHDEWNDIAKDIYAKHETKRELYKRKKMKDIEFLEQQKRRREERLEKLTKDSEDANKDAAFMHNEREKLRNELVELNEQEEREDEELSALVMQIKATLAKKSSLRETLKDAQDMHREANENALKWEQERALFSR